MNTRVISANWRAMFLCARSRIHSEGEWSLLETDETAEFHALCVQPEGRAQTPSPTPSRELRKNSKSQLCLPLVANAAGQTSSSASTSPSTEAPAASPRSRSLFTFAPRSGNSGNGSSSGVHSKAKRKQSRSALLMGSQQCKAGTSEPNSPNEPEHRASPQEVDEMRKAFVVCCVLSFVHSPA